MEELENNEESTSNKEPNLTDDYKPELIKDVLFEELINDYDIAYLVANAQIKMPDMEKIIDKYNKELESRVRDRSLQNRASSNRIHCEQQILRDRAVADINPLLDPIILDYHN